MILQGRIQRKMVVAVDKPRYEHLIAAINHLYIRRPRDVRFLSHSGDGLPIDQHNPAFDGG